MINEPCRVSESDIPLEPASLEARLRAELELCRISHSYMLEENRSLKRQLYRDSAVPKSGPNAVLDATDADNYYLSEANHVMRKALQSIAANSCCDMCHEAALVATTALEALK
jgi:hypothetical protein